MLLLVVVFQCSGSSQGSRGCLYFVFAGAIVCMAVYAQVFRSDEYFGYQSTAGKSLARFFAVHNASTKARHIAV